MAKNDQDQFLDQLETKVTERKDTQMVNQNSQWFKVMEEYLLVSPWKVILPIAIIIGLCLVLVFRGWAIKGVSWLQWGF
jgi:ElaB/YqjD/DUF883 family membrane-anchored ribosome-binding protein